MLENGLITFDLLWALWKPNTLAYTSTYGSHDEPRVFKVEMAEKHYSIMKGEYYYIEGKVRRTRPDRAQLCLCSPANAVNYVVFRVRREAIWLRQHVRRDW